MTKTEFIDRLCEALSIAGSPALTDSNRRFYAEYIDGEIAKGRTEEAVLAELGEPELIANSILDSKGFRNRFVDDDAKTYNAYDTPDGDPTTFAQGFEYREKANDRKDINDDNASTQSTGMSSKAKLIIFAVIAALVLIGIIVLLILLIGGIFKVLGPILIPIICIWLIYKLIKSIMGR